MVELCEQTVKTFLDAVYHQGIPEDARLVLTNTPSFNNGLWFTSVDKAMQAALNPTTSL
jgi:serine protease inhibitor